MFFFQVFYFFLFRMFVSLSKREFQDFQSDFFKRCFSNGNFKRSLEHIGAPWNPTPIQKVYGWNLGAPQKQSIHLAWHLLN